MSFQSLPTSNSCLVTHPREAGLSEGRLSLARNQRPLLGVASTSFPNGPTHRRGGEWGGDCPVQLQREKTPLAGWRVEGVGDRPPSLPFWLVGGAGASSPALPRGHSVLSCSGSVPALFVILLRAGVGGPHGAGGLGGGHGSGTRNRGGAGPHLSGS